MTHSMVSADKYEVARRELAYDPASPSGLVWATHKGGNACLGKPAGGLAGPDGYYKVHLGVRYVMAHRVVWELHNGPIPAGLEVDHRDLNKQNNRIENLRLATRSDNRCNTAPYASNKEGVKGLHYSEKNKCWVGRVEYKGKRYERARVNREEVVKWIAETRERLHGEFHRHS